MHSHGYLASHTDILRASSRVPSPRSPGGGWGILDQYLVMGFETPTLFSTKNPKNTYPV